MTDLPIQPFKFRKGKLFLLDQRLLPLKKSWVECQNAEDVFWAIRKMVVRGAPVIGTVAAYGLALEAKKARKEGSLNLKTIEKAAESLKKSRPTAVNLSWALERSLKAVKGKGDIEGALLEEARKQEAENINWTEKISRIGADLIPQGTKVLTICNTGPLATGGYGTALGAIAFAWKQGKEMEIFALETRPYLQGARLTAWELKQMKIPVTLITDGMAAWTMKKKGINLVLVGADRIALNGDVANKIGTLQLAILSHHLEIPFYPVAPLSSFDHQLKSGEEIKIEERDQEEVFSFGGVRVAPRGVRAFNPAFDVTPSDLITGFITEEGVINPPFSKTIPEALKR